LVDSYAIPHDELVRIAELPPENRGSHVRATQQTSFSDSYAEPDPLPPADDGPSGAVVIVGPMRVHHYHPGELGEAGARPPSRRQPAQLRSSGGGLPPGRGGAASAPSVGKGGNADAAVTAVIAVLTVATGAFSISALTEGPRFDGWVWVPPEQQIMLKPKTAAPYWIPLADLTSQEAATAEDAELTPTKAQLLERAPLNRVGMTTSLEFGGSAMRTTLFGGASGFNARYALGGFPVQWLGLLGNASFSAADDYGSLFDGRLGFELRLMPLHLGPVHLGGYGELGHAWLLHDVIGGTARGDGAYYGGGGLLEVDLTTRLGLLLRAGAASLPLFAGQPQGPDDPLLFPEFSIGLSVY
jgi:hypothetical protein